jgi:hypothetical protein
LDRVMTDTTSGALPGLRAGSPTLSPAGPRTGFSTRNLLGTKAAPLTDPWSGEDDDTGYGYYDTPVRQHLAPRRRARAASGGEPGRARSRVRVMNGTDWARLADAQLTHDSVTASLAVARLRAAGRAAGSRRLSPSLIVRTRHHRPGRGSACPDKETP